jgi:uncharacterized membrane protein YqhA
VVVGVVGVVVVVVVVITISFAGNEAFISSLARKRCSWCPEAINKDRVVMNGAFFFFPITRCHALSFRK